MRHAIADQRGGSSVTLARQLQFVAERQRIGVFGNKASKLVQLGHAFDLRLAANVEEVFEALHGV